MALIYLPLPQNKVKKKIIGNFLYPNSFDRTAANLYLKQIPFP